MRESVGREREKEGERPSGYRIKGKPKRASRKRVNENRLLGLDEEILSNVGLNSGRE